MTRRLILNAVFCSSLAWLVALAGTARAAVLAYEGFDYPNDGSSLLAGMNAGSGWGDAWIFSGQADTDNGGFDVSQDDTSLDSAAFPFSPTGDRVLAAGLGGGNTYRADRALANTFDLGAEGGVLYASFLFQKNGSTTETSNNNMEFDLQPGGIRLGSTSGNEFFLTNGSNTFGQIAFDETYFLVLKVESHAAGTDDVASAMVFGSADTVPTIEPTTWDGTHSFDSDAVTDLVRLWIGSNASGQFDEVRIGETWADVAVVPEPMSWSLLALGGVGLALVHRRRRSAKGAR